MDQGYPTDDAPDDAPLCPKCDAYLVAYDRNDELTFFQHSAEQNTECDGYMQIRGLMSDDDDEY